jgi:hypothetical protein
MDLRIEPMATKKPPTGEHAVRLRIVIEDPVPGVMHSLQDANNLPVAAQRAHEGAPLRIEFEVRATVTEVGVRWLGEHIRREGPERRFAYVAIGKSAGDAASPWERRMKIDVHTIAAVLVAAASRGKVLEVVVPGRGADDTPACATVKPLRAWRAV